MLACTHVQKQSCFRLQWFRSVRGATSHSLSDYFGCQSATCERINTVIMQASVAFRIRRGANVSSLHRNIHDALHCMGVSSIDAALFAGQRFSTASDVEHLIVREEGGLGRITINRPKALNAKNCGASGRLTTLPVSVHSCSRVLWGRMCRDGRGRTQSASRFRQKQQNSCSLDRLLWRQGLLCRSVHTLSGKRQHNHSSLYGNPTICLHHGFVCGLQCIRLIWACLLVRGGHPGYQAGCAGLPL